MDVRSLGYVWIESTDVAKWREFGTEVMGLMSAPGMPQDENVYLKMDARPYRFAIYPGARDRLALCGWELRDQADFETARAELKAAGVAFESVSAADAKLRRVREAIRLQDPSGNTLELYWGADLDYAKFVSPTGIAGFETGFNGDMGLGHAVLPAGKLAETRAFYRDVLGFGDTDYMHFHFNPDPADPGQGLHFMHCNNPRHHSLALYEDGNNPAGCIHLMVEVLDVDEVGYCLDRVNERGVPVVSTLGRHTNDRMLSFYMATPGGFAMEFGTEGLQMDWTDYTPTVSALPSLWGHKFQPQS
ncbi:MAG TPA: VOC family protein [Spongiibacteraceae bacterium]|jgi:3,4-dihydroxy-9,10-secoandrosta-1,3,5(10)-triene-9,17-dione 4,5-dioxygenase|nr:VOC family protein [Spongiibacteraceae bacterium]HUH38596.1 VOC family protein [Spongiibacteraceae bacterium]